MGYGLPMSSPGGSTAETIDELHSLRPLIAAALAVVAFVALAAAIALTGGPAAPIDARSTSPTTAEPVPAVQPVDMRPPRAVPLPPVVTYVGAR